ncbi:MAG: permease [Gammaproteobacteria bacterium]|nr:permease [Gammaproteobacteria bacterium]NIR82066.1 permease [Gammaproteobacteria bacterium]NIR89294.1 permease [Gammaproteobacteria bacterium]NIU03176.1 permease [Gammaproteobacteria bacterium]NIV50692.1 permease [Gammaproteobacteria bacterium]
MELTAARTPRPRRPSGEALVWLVTASLLVAGSLLPQANTELLVTAAGGLLSLLPVVALAAALAGALNLGHWSQRALAWVEGGPTRAVVVASLAGAVTPVCGLGVLPLIATLLRRGLPLAPVMAFWVSSPIMGPSMVVVTISIIGLPFAVAKALAAFGAGVLAGTVTGLLPGYGGPGRRMMRPEHLEKYGCGSEEGGFWHEARASARLVMRWLALALVLEVFLQRLVPDAWIASLFSEDSAASIPLAAVIGAPMYLDGYAALPLVRGLMDMGMSFGAALALMVSGAAVSLYAAVAVASIVRTRVFMLYVVLAMVGACAAGYVASWLS